MEVNLTDIYNVCLAYCRSTIFNSNGGEFSGFGLSLHSTEVSTPTCTLDKLLHVIMLASLLKLLLWEMNAIFSYICKQQSGNRLLICYRLMAVSDIPTPFPRFTSLRIQLKILLWDNFLLKSSWKLSLQRYKWFVKSA